MRLIWFEAQGYKNLRHPVRLDDMQPYNVLHGDNGIGKSNLLEAISAFFEVLPPLVQVQLQALTTEGERRLFSGPFAAQLGELLVRRSATRGGGDPTVEKLVGQPVRDLFALPERSPIVLSAEFEITEEDTLAVKAAQEKVRTPVGPGLSALEPGRHQVKGRLALQEDGKAAQVSLGSWMKDGQELSPLGILLALMTLVHRPPVALVPPSRRLLPAVSLDKTEGESYSYRDLIPPELCLKLNDSEQAEGAAGQAGWRRFLAVMQPFAPLLGGSLGIEWDRSQRRYRLFVRQGDRKLHSWLFSAGVQQVMALLGWLSIHPASLLLLEEPELNLRHTLALRLRDALLALSRGKDGKQILLSTHSVAFESDLPASEAFFYAMQRKGEQISLEKRPAKEAVAFTGNEPFVTPSAPAARLPPCWVSAEGLVEVPERIRGKLGVQEGGGVFFVERKDTGHVELLNEEQFDDLLEPRSEPDADGSEGHGRG